MRGAVRGRRSRNPQSAINQPPGTGQPSNSTSTHGTIQPTNPPSTIHQPSRHQGHPRLSNTASAHPSSLSTRLFLSSPLHPASLAPPPNQRHPSLQPARATESWSGWCRTEELRLHVGWSRSGHPFPRQAQSEKEADAKFTSRNPVTTRPPEPTHARTHARTPERTNHLLCCCSSQRPHHLSTESSITSFFVARFVACLRRAVERPPLRGRDQGAASEKSERDTKILESSSLRGARWIPDSSNSSSNSSHHLSFPSHGMLPHPLGVRPSPGRSPQANLRIQARLLILPRPRPLTPTCTRGNPPTRRRTILPGSTPQSPPICPLPHTRDTRARRR